MKRTVPLFLLVFIAFNNFGQQQFTHTAVKENISCNYDCSILDVADLNNNPAAVIFVTPVLEKGINPNPHPIGAYYFKNKWHILNLDNKAIPVGSRFTVEYFTKPDDTHFQYSSTRADIQQDGSALIDHFLLNNNPTVKFSSFPSWDPANHGALTNREETTVQYNAAAGKWSVSNNSNKPMLARVTYNIAISGPGRVNTQITLPRTSVQITQLTATPNPNADFGGVTGMYMSVWADGVKLPGDNIRAAHLDQTEVHSLEMGTTNLAVRKNIYDAITIRFPSGFPAGIPLLNAFIKKQSMAFTIDAMTTSGTTGQEGITYTVKLTGAYIRSYKQFFFKAGQKIIDPVNSAYDEIKITFTKIEYTNSAGSTAEDIQ